MAGDLLEIHVQLVTDRNMGDHGEMHRIALPSLSPNTPLSRVLELARDQYGNFQKPSAEGVLKAGDVIEIRTVAF